MNTISNDGILYIFILLILISLPLKSLAYNLEADVSWDYSLEYQRSCFDSEIQGHPVSQMEGNLCIAEELEKFNTELQDLYLSLVAVMEEEKMLKDSETAWADFRDKECKLRNSGMGEDQSIGSTPQALLDSCLLDLTVKRINDLKRLKENLDCIGCPVTKASMSGLKLD